MPALGTCNLKICCSGISSTCATIMRMTPACATTSTCLPRWRVVQGIPRLENPAAKPGQRFRAWRSMRNRIAAETDKRFGIFRGQLIGRAALPGAETQLDQAIIDIQRQSVARGQLTGKIRASQQRRTDDGLPRAMLAHRPAHLRPALFAQGIVQLPAVFASAHRFAVAHQVQRRDQLVWHGIFWTRVCRYRCGRFKSAERRRTA